eukprot:gene52762-2529_t
MPKTPPPPPRPPPVGGVIQPRWKNMGWHERPKGMKLFEEFFEALLGDADFSWVMIGTIKWGKGYWIHANPTCTPGGMVDFSAFWRVLSIVKIHTPIHNSADDLFYQKWIHLMVASAELGCAHGRGRVCGAGLHSGSAERLHSMAKPVEQSAERPHSMAKPVEQPQPLWPLPRRPRQQRVAGAVRSPT